MVNGVVVVVLVSLDLRDLPGSMRRSPYNRALMRQGPYSRVLMTTAVHLQGGVEFMPMGRTFFKKKMPDSDRCTFVGVQQEDATSIKRAQSLFVAQNLTTDRIFRTQACQEPRVKVALGARRVWASFVVFNEGAFGALRTPSGQRDWGSCGSILPFISYLFLTRRYKGEAIKRQVAL